MNRLTSVCPTLRSRYFRCCCCGPVGGSHVRVIGLETPAGWAVSASSMPSGFRVSSTNERTQGSAAYAVANSPKTIAPGV